MIDLKKRTGNQVLYDDDTISIELTDDGTLVGLKGGMEVGCDGLLEVCRHLFDEEPKAEHEKEEINHGRG